MSDEKEHCLELPSGIVVAIVLSVNSGETDISLNREPQDCGFMEALNPSSDRRWILAGMLFLPFYWLVEMCWAFLMERIWLMPWAWLVFFLFFLRYHCLRRRGRRALPSKGTF